MNEKRLSDQPSRGHPRVQGSVGILEDYLNLSPYGLHFSRIVDIGGEILTSYFYCSFRRFQQAHYHFADGGFSTATLTNHSENLARVYVKRHILHGMYISCRSTQQTFTYFKYFREIVHFQ